MSAAPHTPRPRTSAPLSTRAVPVLAPHERADAVRGRLAGHRFASIRDLPVCAPDGRLLGALRIEDLVGAAPEATVAEMMDDDPPRLAAATAPEVAAWHAVRHGESSLLLVDGDGRFTGLVPPDRLLGVLLREHERDVARRGGFLASAETARHASQESVGRRLGHRLPWLLVGLVGALAAAGILSGFEGRLRENVLLAVFVPGVVYLADAVGTQTEALVIRGLSLGIRIRDVVVRELVTGVLAGVLLGLLFFPIGLLIWGDAALVAAVAVSLAGACATANAVAMALPGILQRLGTDPAFGSGPLATVVQDLLSISIYLGVVVLLGV